MKQQDLLIAYYGDGGFLRHISGIKENMDSLCGKKDILPTRMDSFKKEVLNEVFFCRKCRREYKNILKTKEVVDG
jgi:hypothetical protein